MWTRHLLDALGGAAVGGFLVFLWENSIIKDLRQSLIDVRQINDRTAANRVAGMKQQ